jgi:hypothetical protein
LEPEAIEIPSYSIVAGVAFLKGQLSRKLRLSRCLEPGGDCRDPDLRAFRVEVATETLKVSAEVQDAVQEIIDAI